MQQQDNRNAAYTLEQPISPRVVGPTEPPATAPIQYQAPLTATDIARQDASPRPTGGRNHVFNIITILAAGIIPGWLGAYITTIAVIFLAPFEGRLQMDLWRGTASPEVMAIVFIGAALVYAVFVRHQIVKYLNSGYVSKLCRVLAIIVVIQLVFGVIFSVAFRLIAVPLLEG